MGATGYWRHSHPRIPSPYLPAWPGVPHLCIQPHGPHFSPYTMPAPWPPPPQAPLPAPHFLPMPHPTSTCPHPHPTFSPLMKRSFSLRFTWSMERPCSARDSKATVPSGLDTTRPFLPVICAGQGDRLVASMAAQRASPFPHVPPGLLGVAGPGLPAGQAAEILRAPKSLTVNHCSGPTQELSRHPTGTQEIGVRVGGGWARARVPRAHRVCGPGGHAAGPEGGG